MIISPAPHLNGCDEPQVLFRAQQRQHTTHTRIAPRHIKCLHHLAQFNLRMCITIIANEGPRECSSPSVPGKMNRKLCYERSWWAQHKQQPYAQSVGKQK